MEPAQTRLNAPKHTPHPHVARLRATGWTTSEIAAYVGASLRAVARWTAGDTRPLPIYEAALEDLLGASPAKVVRLREALFPPGSPVWLVEVRITQRHARLVLAESADEAKAVAFARGWGAETLDETESVELLDEPLLRDDFDGEESP